MQFEERLQQLVESDWSLDQSSPNVLVIVLGDTARKYVELGGLKEHVTTNTVAGHVASLLSLVLRQCLSLPSKVEFYPEPPSSSVPARLLRFWDHIIR
ncbi:Shu1p [Saccharomyces cerevisiae]|nr:Shu1p [Saccharomyces cerevisiae]